MDVHINWIVNGPLLEILKAFHSSKAYYITRLVDGKASI